MVVDAGLSEAFRHLSHTTFLEASKEGRCRRYIAPRVNRCGSNAITYPSPPMSTPPSPPHPYSEQRHNEAPGFPPAVIATASSLQRVTADSTRRNRSISDAYRTSVSDRPPEHSSVRFSGAEVGPSTSRQIHFDPQSSSTSGQVTPIIRESAHRGPLSGVFAGGLPALGVAASSSSARGGRKVKAHVASACVNCKRAHLSCDVQRPCERCVATGKQV